MVDLIHDNDGEDQPVVVPGEVVQDMIYRLIVQSNLSYGEALKAMGFVVARLLYRSNTDPDTVRQIILHRFPKGVSAAFDCILLAETEQEPGQKPN